jgi:WASH complex subunit strumpellin
MDQDNKSSISSQFLAPQNLCGQTLLSIVGRGHSILADIRILSERVPPAFLAAAHFDDKTEEDTAPTGLFGYFSAPPKPTKRIDDEPQDTEDVKKYVPFLFDFSYLHNPEEWEASLAIPQTEPSQESLADLEREFAINHKTIVEEFYNLFYSIYEYHAEVNQFASDLSKGYFIQYTVESVLLDGDGRALLCEAVWLYGVMLIMMERFLPVSLHLKLISVCLSFLAHNAVLPAARILIQGPIRERLIIAYFRFCGRDGDISRIDTICKLCKSTGVKPMKSGSISFATDKSFKYPMEEDILFARYPIPIDLVRNIVGALISDDIYQQASVFPNIDHRSIRLSRQASMLYVILFFDPVVLRDEQGKLREVVDKYFHDNWVVHVYAGLTADLSLEWNDRFPAAKSALDNTLMIDNVKRLHIQNAKLIGQCMAELRAYLTMGILTDKFVLDNKHDLLNCLRRCNIAARWRILHRRCATQEYREIVCATSETFTTDPKLEGDFVVTDAHVVSLLLLSSQLEMQLKEIFRDLLDKKGSIWVTCRDQASEIMNDLAIYFKGDQTLARVSRHDGLISWFTSMADEIQKLTYESGDHFTVTGRRIQLCVQALEDVEQYDLVDRDVQVKSFLSEARGLLLQMARVVGINETICGDIQWISDMSYGIESVKSYVTIIHTRVTKDPSNVALLQGFFLKLSSSLDGPVERLKQLNSPKAEKVTGYYSSELVSFVRKVLEIVPVSVFGLLVQISDIFERRLVRLPKKVAADQLITYSQMGERYKVGRSSECDSLLHDIF